MKRLDDFELFHQRRKRRPLADISGGNTTCNNRVPSRHLGPKQHHISEKELRNNTNLIHFQNNNHLENANQWSKTYNVCDSGSKTASPHEENRKITANSTRYITERGNATAAHKPIPLTHIRNFLSAKKLTKDSNTPKPKPKHKIPISFLSAHLRCGAPPASRPSARYRLLSSLIDYNPAVEKSNAAIRSFYDMVKLSSSFPDSSADGKSASILLPTMSDDIVTVSRVTKISPLLLAVTTSQDEDILLMNTQEIQVSVGNMLSLSEFHTHEIGGVSRKAYYKWKVA